MQSHSPVNVQEIGTIKKMNYMYILELKSRWYSIGAAQYVLLQGRHFSSEQLNCTLDTALYVCAQCAMCLVPVTLCIVRSYVWPTVPCAPQSALSAHSVFICTYSSAHTWYTTW